MNVVLYGNMFITKGRWRMRQLVARFGKAVKGVLRGFDRIVFKGTILPLAHEDGAMSFLNCCGVLNRDYKKWMQAQTDALVSAVDRYAREESGRPIVHLDTWRYDKEQLARKRQEQTGIDVGFIGAWSCLESCWSYRARYCAEKGYPQLRRYTTQCKHLYLYLDHEQYGWMNVRLQTWSRTTCRSLSMGANGCGADWKHAVWISCAKATSSCTSRTMPWRNVACVNNSTGNGRAF